MAFESRPLMRYLKLELEITWETSKELLEKERQRMLIDCIGKNEINPLDPYSEPVVPGVAQRAEFASYALDLMPSLSNSSLMRS